ncbi:MAG: rRNA maturation RNase YbeY [Candidatus Caenarcaniphilales bacterium]|nr:rRNA maturation RNase YbeY [Candidatus Caenarcaniphilales bacterium]
MFKYKLDPQIICYKRNKLLNKSWWEFNVHKLALIALETQTTISLNNFEDNTLCFSVMIVANQKIKELNDQFRDINNETDVLSFPVFENFNKSLKFEYDRGMEIEFGDIVISLDKLQEQAQDLNHSVEREAAFLFVHGFLHLLGYDHEEESQSKVMFSLQDKVLEKAGFPRK